jgi:hypothetical protein
MAKTSPPQAQCADQHHGTVSCHLAVNAKREQAHAKRYGATPKGPNKQQPPGHPAQAFPPKDLGQHGGPQGNAQRRRKKVQNMPEGAVEAHDQLPFKNLETAAGRARFGGAVALWQGATARRARARKAEQRRQRATAPPSAFTQKVRGLVCEILSVHQVLPADISGQMRFKGVRAGG